MTDYVQNYVEYKASRPKIFGVLMLFIAVIFFLIVFFIYGIGWDSLGILVQTVVSLALILCSYVCFRCLMFLTWWNLSLHISEQGVLYTSLQNTPIPWSEIEHINPAFDKGLVIFLKNLSLIKNPFKRLLMKVENKALSINFIFFNEKPQEAHAIIEKYYKNTKAGN